MLSRGMSGKELIDNKFWFSGPHFLEQKKIEIENFKVDKNDGIPELKSIKKVGVLINKDSLWDKINHKSDFNYLQNVIAQIYKFTQLCKKTELLSWGEYRKIALNVIIKNVQGKHFKEEIKSLQKGKVVTSNSKLSTLSPFLDNDGLIRVGGRIENSKLSFEAKHPILLPYGDKYVELMIKGLHIKHLHVGPQGLLAIIRQKYWPLRGKQLTTKI
ncbi:uncharacterized protein LOC118756317, partial [Rhagoletis pomonella]|uniref:uncharacterized protein LOC118756317 n=1 Tax=Rhagoletis pomonella TaxID=28610 RepID=UPI001785C050